MWAQWVSTGRKVHGLGYPSQPAFMREAGGSHNSSPTVNEDALQVESCVRLLEHDLHLLVQQFYLRAGTADSHARHLGICRDTLYARLHRAHVFIYREIYSQND